jgi:hypothetical protein
MPRVDEIVDEICDSWLGRHPSARKQVLRRMEVLRRTTQVPAIDLDQIRADGKTAQRVIPEIRGLNIHPPAELLGVALQAKARIRDQLPRLCAWDASELIKEFSTGEPVGTTDGNMHAITQLLYEAITGEPGSKASCLRAARWVINPGPGPSKKTKKP